MQSSDSRLPLVSVGVPTYNRAKSLVRAVQSVLSQDYPNLELVISDNASQDDTQAVIERIAAGDPRVRYVRQPVNQGLTRNFIAALHHARGELFMWLADDDWLDAHYIAACTQQLLADPSCSSVAGNVRYWDGAISSVPEPPMDLLDDAPQARVLDFFSRVDGNGIYYGIMRRARLTGIRYANVYGNDWFVMGAMACQGRARTLPDVYLNKSRGGISRTMEDLLSGLELKQSAQTSVFLRLGYDAFLDIAILNRGYRGLSRPQRLVLGLQVADVLWGRKPMPAWWWHYRVNRERFLKWRRRFARSG